MQSTRVSNGTQVHSGCGGKSHGITIITITIITTTTAAAHGEVLLLLGELAGKQRGHGSLVLCKRTERRHLKPRRNLRFTTVPSRGRVKLAAGRSNLIRHPNAK